MASFTWASLIARAKTYCDDDHNDEKSWISDERWLTLANVEYAQLYRRWVRSGLITPAITTDYMEGSSTTFNGVLAIIGVAKDYGDFVRLLVPAQPSSGANPFWRGSTQPEAPSTRWTATGAGNNVTIELDPEPDDLTYDGSTGNYIVRYIPSVTYATDDATTVELPDGADERLVLGIARRAQLKDSGASALLERLLMDADAELNFTAAGKVDGMRVRRRPKQALLSTPSRFIWPQRSEWIFY